MSRYQEIQKALDDVSPTPADLPKLYFLGDTGAGKTTIIRKFLGTEDSSFPTTRQKRTTVAPTEYVIHNSDGFDITVVLKTLAEVESYVDEILRDAIGKLYRDRQKDRIIKNIRQTNDERFRLYYLLSKDFSAKVAKSIEDLLPLVDNSVHALQKEFPDDQEETGVFVEWALKDLGEPYDLICTSVISEIQRLTALTCGGEQLSAEWKVYKYESESKASLIDKCKEILSSEAISISPVIEHARIRGKLAAPWLSIGVEAVFIDGEGIGHDAKEAGQLDSRHYDYFYNSDTILLIEESKKPFIAGGKSALKGIFQRGYGEKLIVLFTKLDEVEPSDADDPTDDDRIEDVRDGLANVVASIRGEGQEIELGDERILFLGGLQQPGMNPSAVKQVNLIFSKAREMLRFQRAFIKPEYDFEMLLAFLLESTKRFNSLYQSKLSVEHWKTVEAFNRRMEMGIDGFRMFIPVTDFEEQINKEIEAFISRPISWEQEVSDTLKRQSLDKIRREFNKLIIDFARREIVNVPHDAWEVAWQYGGPGSTSRRKADIEAILKRSVPSSASAERVKEFKDHVKQLLEKAISKCESIPKARRSFKIPRPKI